MNWLICAAAITGFACLEFVVMGLYWWHPVVWYARRELREAEEQCCDAWVVSTLPGAGRTYASALVDTLDFLSDGPDRCAAAGQRFGSDFRSQKEADHDSAWHYPAHLSWPGCFGILALGALLLPLLPALQAEPPKPKDDKETTVPNTIAQQVDEEVRNVELGKAKANLAQAEADLRAKMAQVQQAKDVLEAAAANARVAEAQLAEQKHLRLWWARTAGDKVLVIQQRATTVRDQAAPGGDHPMIRIEILVSAEGISPEKLAQFAQEIVECAAGQNRHLVHSMARRRSPRTPLKQPLP